MYVPKCTYLCMVYVSKWGMCAYGIWVHVCAQAAAFGVTAVTFFRDTVLGSYSRWGHMRAALRLTGEERNQYLGILAPILVCEFVWSLGENMYAVIYGRMGTAPCAAMTMTGPIQGLMIGLLRNLSANSAPLS